MNKKDEINELPISSSTCCDFLDWVNLHTYFWKTPHMKLWYDRSKWYGEKGFTTMQVYELFIEQHNTKKL